MFFLLITFKSHRALLFFQIMLILAIDFFSDLNLYKTIIKMCCYMNLLSFLLVQFLMLFFIESLLVVLFSASEFVDNIVVVSVMITDQQ